MTPLRAFLVLRRDLVCFYRVVIIVALHHRTSMVHFCHKSFTVHFIICAYVCIKKFRNQHVRTTFI
jgi:hypothetical protein